MDIYEWKLSAKGNSYTEIDGLNCVVGKNKFGSFFGLVDGEFLPQAFSSLDEAKDTAVSEASQRSFSVSPFEELFGGSDHEE
jgi:hypothetical protein